MRSAVFSLLAELVEPSDLASGAEEEIYAGRFGNTLGTAPFFRIFIFRVGIGQRGLLS
jgi:hypothetical protein